jgi:hypothetical protein
MAELKDTRTVFIHLKRLLFFYGARSIEKWKALGFQQWDKANRITESFFSVTLIFVNMVSLTNIIS